MAKLPKPAMNPKPFKPQQAKKSVNTKLKPLTLGKRKNKLAR